MLELCPHFSYGSKISRLSAAFLIFILSSGCLISAQSESERTENNERERISINLGWRFFKYETASDADSLIYDSRPAVSDHSDDRVADSRPTEAAITKQNQRVLKEWILPSGNAFIKDPARKHTRPEGNPGKDFPFVQHGYDDSDWIEVNLPHDWAINGPFQTGRDAEVGGGMGRLPVNGVAWYRKKIFFPESDSGRSVYLDVDGAMSYAMVWLNGHLVGGWPYGYNSWRLDLTPYIVTDTENQLAIRLDNPAHSARWYPGGGIYRNVWLVKTNSIHIAQWGTYVTTNEVCDESATLKIEVKIENESSRDATIKVVNRIYELDTNGKRANNAVAGTAPAEIAIAAGETSLVRVETILPYPRLWGPLPYQYPYMYTVLTELVKEGRIIDTYETPIGVRSLKFNPDQGILVNGQHVPIRGVNQHHDLGALGAAFNLRAAERQLELLREMGCNAIRTSHNPPAPGLLDLTDRMGFLVIDEIFDSWYLKKTPLDFHLIFPEWYEQDTRAFVRRDRNHPSVIIWSYGNEVGEQYTGEEGATVARKLAEIVREEDSLRPSATAMNYARPGMVMSGVSELISLNYQGEGIRDAPAYADLQGIRTAPLYNSFREAYPGKVILSSETASTLSTRGTYLFPVFSGISAPAKDGNGGDPVSSHVSAYEIYTAAFGASPDKVFSALDHHPFVAGEFVWTGWDYLGEPTPYYVSRSSYSGIIDLAGFKKDRFYLYQSRWRPELSMAHLLPAWNWPERTGEITPVHLFTSGDEAELFLNGRSLGRLKKGPFEYRLRWDSVIYEPGILKAVAYKNGIKWAEDQVETTEAPVKLEAEADRIRISADGSDLTFITVRVTDRKGRTVPRSDNLVSFIVRGPGEIIATDNGDPADMTSFASHSRKVYNGLVLVIVKSVAGKSGTIKVSSGSPGLRDAIVKVTAR